MALEKIAAAVRDMAVDFVNELAGSGKTITSVVSVTLTPSSGAPVISSSAAVGTQVKFRCTGGVAGQTYQVDVKIAVSGGEEMVGRVQLRVT